MLWRFPILSYLMTK